MVAAEDHDIQDVALVDTEDSQVLEDTTFLDTKANAS